MADYLPPGSQVDGFEIRRVLADDQESVDYEAWHASEQRTVRVKEFLPDDLVERLDGTTVASSPDIDQALFDAELNRFLAQHHRLQLIDHPAVLKVLQCLRANGTGYVVMDAPPGETLADVLDRRETLPASELAALWPPLLEGLEAVHRANLLHGGITPEHILLPRGGSPILWGFRIGHGAAGSPRQAFGSALPRRVEAPTAGYAALEQYSERGHEGRWTDMYALGAVLYRCVTGAEPPDAPGRAIEDELVPAGQAAEGRYEQRLLAAIDAALAMRVINRPQTVAAWREMMAAADEARPAPAGPRGRIAARGGARSAAPSSAPRVESGRKAGEREPKRPNWTVPAVAATAFIAVLTYVDTGVLRSPDEESPVEAPRIESAPQGAEEADFSQALVSSEPAIAEPAPAEEPMPDSGAASRPTSEPREPADEVSEAGSEVVDSRTIDAVPARPQGAVSADGDWRPSAEPVVAAAGELEADIAQAEVETGPMAAPQASADFADTTSPDAAEPDTERIAERLAQTVEPDAEAASERVAGGTEPAREDGLGAVPQQVADVVEAAAPEVLESPAQQPPPPNAESELAQADSAPADDGPSPPAPEADLVEESAAIAAEPSRPAVDAAAAAALLPFTVVSDPPGAAIHFADQSRSYRPGMMIPPDGYRLTAELPGYETWEGELVHSASAGRHSVTLKPLAAREFADRLRSGGTGPMMVRIEPGSSVLGCVSGIRCFSNELPVFDVAIADAYAISMHEITVGDYAAFVEATDYAAMPAAAGETSHPMASVNWVDAVAYADWLTSETGRRYRLPTETEWEHAARAGTRTAYSWGDEVIAQRSACSGCDASDLVSGAAPVGSFEANAWGVHDMHGNVWEWVLDCGDQPRQILQPGLEHKRLGDCRHRVRRGGSWDNSPRRVRSASRDITGESLRSPNTGFRVMLLNP